MERTAEAKPRDSVRRAEIVLHGLRSLEPAASYFQQELLWDIQLRTLKTIASLNGSGALDPEARQRLIPRLHAMLPKPDPARQAFLLVDGWMQMELRHMADGLTSEKADDSLSDAVFFRSIYRKIDELRKHGRSGESACVAVARVWKKSGNVTGLPTTAPMKAGAAAQEADYLHRFCDKRREITWFLNSVLNMMNFDSHQEKRGRLPAKWESPLNGGGTMEFVSGENPAILLRDTRDDAQRAGPSWLGRQPDPAQPAWRFPLRPMKPAGLTAKGSQQ
jgi:hypothetical protein